MVTISSLHKHYTESSMFSKLLLLKKLKTTIKNEAKGRYNKNLFAYTNMYTFSFSLADILTTKINLCTFYHKVTTD